ncbi:hypothetical protein ACQV5M_08195 [Leptospira sp. SA-E8]
MRKREYLGEIYNPELSISKEALEILLHHNWNNNIRELQNVIQGRIRQ